MKKNRSFLNLSNGSSNDKTRRQKSRSLRLENLERRELLDAAGVDSSAALLQDSIVVNVAPANVEESAPIDLSAVEFDPTNAPLQTEATQLVTPTISVYSRTTTSISVKLNRVLAHADQYNFGISTSSSFSSVSELQKRPEAKVSIPASLRLADFSPVLSITSAYARLRTITQTMLRPSTAASPTARLSSPRKL